VKINDVILIPLDAASNYIPMRLSTPSRWFFLTYFTVGRYETAWLHEGRAILSAKQLCSPAEPIESKHVLWKVMPRTYLGDTLRWKEPAIALGF
jgi:hypothetical protein